MTNLYEISKDILAIMQEIEDDYDPLAVDQNDIASRFDSLQIKFNDKVENICKYIRDMETDDVKLRTEAVRLATLADSKKKTAERLKNYVSSILQVQ
jgi:DNA repair ATPase RecN